MCCPPTPGGAQWEICLDPADMGDRDYFLETVLHEYCHYLTLNHRQADYRGEPTVETYCEAGMVSREGSYLDDFCQRFWTGYLDDRLADLDSYNFFLRHEEDFVSSYASTDPSEDISESFAFFVLWDVPESEAVWAEKLRFFLDYPELTEFRRRCGRIWGWSSRSRRHKCRMPGGTRASGHILWGGREEIRRGCGGTTWRSKPTWVVSRFRADRASTPSRGVFQQ